MKAGYVTLNNISSFINALSEGFLLDGGAWMNEFEEIYGKYMKVVYNFVMKLSNNSHIAEEITQQTFVTALEKLDTFRGECKMSVWLCQIAKYEYFAWERKAKRHRPYEPDDGSRNDDQETGRRNRMEGQMSQAASQAGQAETGGDELVNAMIDREDYGRIMEVWHGLPEPYKEVFMLHTMAEMAYPDIGKLFGKSANWSRVTYYRAKKMIIEGLGGV